MDLPKSPAYMTPPRLCVLDNFVLILDFDKVSTWDPALKADTWSFAFDCEETLAVVGKGTEFKVATFDMSAALALVPTT